MTIKFSIEDNIARVTIDREDRMNAIDQDTAEALEVIWNKIEADYDLRAVVITGVGSKAFCAGADMKDNTGSKSGLSYWSNANPNGFGGLTLRKSLKIPVIARVNGIAVGGGFELVLGCDIVVAASHASFGLPEARVGRLPLDGGMILLPRLIPEKIAMGMLLTGKRISATEAENFGIVNQVTNPENLDEAVDEWLTQILECAPLSIQAIKESVKETLHLNSKDAAKMKLPMLIKALESRDSIEGPLAFREKRKPEWQGK
tara:strand:+ start:292 stop:1071 length:780 start_codon:yes stop_codon:yes gene_type:complete